MYLPKRSVFEGYICFIFLAFVLSFGVTMLSCMAGNESEAIKKSGIRDETNVYTNLKVYHFLIKKCTTPNRLQRYA